MFSELQIELAAERLRDSLQPRAVYLFGSYAWGQPEENSDLDFMVVVDRIDGSLPKLIGKAHMSLHDLRLRKDILVRSKNYFDELSAVPASLEAKVMRQGRKLYERR